MAKQNYYAILVGRKPGIYESWNDCKEQTDKFPGAQYKGFSTLDEAKGYMNGTQQTPEKCPESSPTNVENISNEYDAVFYVDGSYYEEYDTYGYGVVALLKDGSIETFSNSGNNEETKKLRNVAGEMLGALYATKWALKQNYKHIAICYDYMGIESWATGQWKTNTELTTMYAETMQKWMKKIVVDFVKVKGHSGVKYNELADSLAKKAIEKI